MLHLDVNLDIVDGSAGTLFVRRKVLLHVILHVMRNVFYLFLLGISMFSLSHSLSLSLFIRTSLSFLTFV
jgi:hypothetical protein